MNPLMVIVVLSVPFAGSEEQNPVYGGKTLTEWKTQTGARFTLSERRKGIQAIQALAWRRTVPLRRSEDIHWVATEIVPTLTALLHDGDSTIRMEAARAICNIRRDATEQAISVLTDLLGDRDDRIRLAAASGLAFRGRQAAPSIPALVKVVRNDESLRVRQVAAQALATAGPEGQDALLVLTSEKNVEIRRLAVGAITVCPTWIRLVQILHDEDGEVRSGGVRILFRLKPLPSEAIPVVAGLFRDKDAKVRHSVVSQLVGREEAGQFATELIALQNDESSGVCSSATLTLARMGRSEAVAPLVKLLDDKRPNTRAEAADILGDMGAAAKDAVPALKEHLTDMGVVFDLQGLVCNHAGKALEKITGDKSFLNGLPPMPVDGK